MRRGAKKRDEGQTLKAEVREALLKVLRDKSSPATARASAGKTLYEMWRDETGGDGGDEPASEMSADEIDAEIARLQAKPQRSD